MTDGPIDVRTRFERFPVSIKGAFVLRGADGNPHGVRVVSARVSRLPAGPEKPIEVEDWLVDVAPARDLFLPFEVSVGDLEPAWYGIRSSIEVDGGRPRDFFSRAFCVPWPRGDVRRGSVHVGRSVSSGARTFEIERVDLGPDCATVLWRPGEESVGSGEAVLVVDGLLLEVLPEDRLAWTGRETRLGPRERRTTSYPVMRSARSAGVQVRVSARERSELVEIRLP